MKLHGNTDEVWCPITQPHTIVTFSLCIFCMVLCVALLISNQDLINCSIFIKNGKVKGRKPHTRTHNTHVHTLLRFECLIGGAGNV